MGAEVSFTKCLQKNNFANAKQVKKIVKASANGLLTFTLLLLTIRLSVMRQRSN